MTFDEWATLWSDVTGVKSKFEATLPKEAPSTNGGFDFKAVLLQTGDFLTEFGFTGGDPNVVEPEEVSDLHLIRHWDFNFALTLIALVL